MDYFIKLHVSVTVKCLFVPLGSPNQHALSCNTVTCELQFGKSMKEGEYSFSVTCRVVIDGFFFNGPEPISPSLQLRGPLSSLPVPFV